jgi:putative two-component system response regulator
MVLRPFFNLYAVDNIEVAWQVLREQTIDLVTLDLKLPRRQGMELLKEMKREYEDIEVIIITGYGSLQSAMEGIRYGAAAYLLKPFNVTELLEVVNQTLEKKRRFDHLRDALRICAHLWGSKLNPKEVWTHLSQLLEAKHPELVRHANRVKSYASLLGERVGLSREDQDALELGACLHDIGKVGIDERGFHRVGQIDPVQQDLLKSHVERGYRMASPLSLPPQVLDIIRHHHEYVNGSGYPDQLRGDDIPYLTRMVCLANEFDHHKTDPIDHKPLTHEQAKEFVISQAGVRYDAQLAQLFVQVVG